MRNSLKKGPDTLTKAEILRRATAAMQDKKDEFRQDRITNANENLHDAIDTPYEVDIFTGGKISPIDSVIEVERLAKARTEAIGGKSSRNTNDTPEEINELNNPTPKRT